MNNNYSENELTEFKIIPIKQTNNFTEFNGYTHELIEKIDYLWEKLWGHDNPLE